MCNNKLHISSPFGHTKKFDMWHDENFSPTLEPDLMCVVVTLLQMKQMETDYMTFRLLTPQVQLMNWILPPVVFFNINIVWHDFFCLFVPPPDIESKNGRLDAVFKTNNKEERCCVGYTAWLCKYIVNYLNVFSCSLLFCFVFPRVCF